MKIRVFTTVATVLASTFTFLSLPSATIRAAEASPFDSSFGTDGIAIHEIPMQPSDSLASDLQANANGDIHALIVANPGTGLDSFVIGKYSSDGTPMSNFGTNGRSEPLRLVSPNMALQSDGKILVAGTQFKNGAAKIVLYRLTANGTRDNTFADNGMYSAPNFPGKNFGSSEVLIAVNNSDGRIYVGLTIENAGRDNYNLYFFALTSDGEFDYSWGSGAGIEILSKTGGVSAWTNLTSVLLLNDGSLLGVASGFGPGTGRQMILVKINSSGFLDHTFDGSSNGNGIVYTQFASETDAYMTSAVELSGGSIVVAGVVGAYYYGPWYYGAAKFNSSGAVDTTFGNSGFSLSTVEASYSTSLPKRLTVQPDGRLIFPINSNTTGGFIRVESNGTYSSSTGCFQCMWNGTSDNVEAMSLLLQSDGKIVMAGRLRDNSDGVIGRFLSIGSADSSFSNVVLELAAEPWETFVFKSTALSDGSILSVGFTRVSRGMNEIYRGFVMKLKTDGSLDTQFGNGGYQFLTPPNDTFWLLIQDMLIQPDGKILILGYGRENYQNSSVMIWRVNANGSVDNSFGTNGLAFTSESSVDLSPTSIIRLTSGDLIVALTRYVNYEGKQWLYKYTTSGSLDPSFTDSQNFSGGIQLPIGSSGQISVATSAGNNSLYIAGYATINAQTVGYLARVLSDGTLDSTFSSGFVTWQIQQAHSLDDLSAIHVTAQGKIYLLGKTESPAQKNSIVQWDATGSLNTSFNSNGYLEFVYRNPSEVDNVSVYSMIEVGGNITIVGGGDSDLRVSRQNLFSAIAQTTSTGGLNTSFGTNGILFPFSNEESMLTHITQLSETSSLVSGIVFRDDTYKIILAKLGPTTSSPNSPAPTNTQTAVPTSPAASPSQVPQQALAATTATDDIKLVISVTQATLLNRMKLSIPKGGKVLLKVSSPKVCRIVRGKVMALSTGTCRVTATVTIKKKKTTKSTSFRVM